MRRARLSLRVPVAPPKQSLCDALDQLLDTGVVVGGELIVKVADIELLYVALELVACSYEKARSSGVRDHTAVRRDRPAEEV
ncbi:MAG: gas vesicle protein [Candidatus Riflebacteria bacterium]|nr:gas vesicle protein [Candidatus Riflebacteria bacterium]